jgi:hypothetical protein
MRRLMMLAAVAGTALLGVGANAAPVAMADPSLTAAAPVQMVDWDRGGDGWRHREWRRHEEWRRWREHEAWERSHRWHRWHEAERARPYGW